MKDRIERILEVINTDINPMLELHNGGCEFVGLEENVLTVRLQGGCVGCPSAKMTLLNGILPVLRDKVPELEDVLLEL